MSKELLFSITKSDFDWEPIRGSGPGGQHRNKTSTGIRITHRASGASATATDSKSQHTNKQNAWKRVIETPKFKVWLKKECLKYKLDFDEIDRWVTRQMNEDNLQIEYGE